MAHNAMSELGTSPGRVVEQWQRRLLPAMRGSLVLLTFFFFVTRLFQYYQLYGDIRQQPFAF